MEFHPTLRRSDQLERELVYLIQPKTWRWGCVCHFFALNEKIGVKLFQRKDDRNHSWRMQSLAAEHKLGPETGDKFTIKQVDFHASFKVETWHGFLTQRAKCIEYQRRVVDRIVEKLKEIGIQYTDSYKANFGKIGNRIVVIDFGAESCHRIRV